MKHNSRNWLIIIAIIFLLLVSIGLYYNSANGDSPCIEDRAGEFFDISVFPMEIEKDDEIQRINYRVILENKSEQTFENLNIYFMLDSNLLPFLAAGMQTVNLGEYTLVSKKEAESTSGVAYGVECRYEPALVSETVLAEKGLSYNDCLKFGKHLSIILKWDGGEETYDYVIPDE